jgi:histidyl-tRNA synthetase
MKAPQLLSGFRDLLPQEMALRQRVLDAIRKIFERHGFDPLETPSLEYHATLTGKEGGESEMLMYHFRDHGDRQVGLIYDLTVPLARVMAAHPEIPKPFKRYQIQRVWRAEKPQKGRYREFCQCDFDVVGAESMMADAQIISVLAEGAAAAGFEHYKVTVNHRQVLQGILEAAGVPPEKAKDAIIAIDKLDKVGESGVAAELEKRGIADPGAVLGAVMVGGDSASMLSELGRMIGSSEAGKRGLSETEELLGLVGYLGPRVQFSPSLARGQGYYTGPVYEVQLDSPPPTGASVNTTQQLGAGKIGSIAGGGRYDGLIGIFSGTRVPATGASFGIDRMTAALAELGKAGESVGARVLVCHFGAGAARAALEAASGIREAGAACDVYAGEAALGKQLKYADKKGFAYAVIIGEDEVRSGEFVIKDLKANAQEKVPAGDISKHLSKLLAREKR